MTYVYIAVLFYISGMRLLVIRHGVLVVGERVGVIITKMHVNWVF